MRRTPDFGSITRGRASVRFCEFWIVRHGYGPKPVRCEKPAYWITDGAIAPVEGYFCEEHILVKAVEFEKYEVEGWGL